MKIAVGCDHGGYEMKLEIIKHLENQGHEVCSYGANGTEPFDYPFVARDVSRAILNGDSQKGILICGTGIGVSIAANKFNGIRASVCTDEFTAKYTVIHNDSNILCLGARVTGIGKALEMVDIYFASRYEGGRHDARLQAINDIEKEN